MKFGLKVKRRGSVLHLSASHTAGSAPGPPARAASSAGLPVCAVSTWGPTVLGALCHSRRGAAELQLPPPSQLCTRGEVAQLQGTLPKEKQR